MLFFAGAVLTQSAAHNTRLRRDTMRIRTIKQHIRQACTKAPSSDVYVASVDL